MADKNVKLKSGEDTLYPQTKVGNILNDDGSAWTPSGGSDYIELPFSMDNFVKKENGEISGYKILGNTITFDMVKEIGDGNKKGFVLLISDRGVDCGRLYLDVSIYEINTESSQALFAILGYITYINYLFSGLDIPCYCKSSAIMDFSADNIVEFVPLTPSLPSDASSKTYVLKAVNGTLTWVEEA